MVEVARVLLEAGADVNKRTSDGRTPLFLALKVYVSDSEQEKQGKAKIAALLREAGAQEPTALELQQMEQEIAQKNAKFQQLEQEIAQHFADFEEGSEEESGEDY
jgi:uncharacterized protein (DUF3084 family)